MHELETYSNNRSNSTEVTWLSIKKKKTTEKAKIYLSYRTAFCRDESDSRKVGIDVLVYALNMQLTIKKCHIMRKKIAYKKMISSDFKKIYVANHDTANF